jgi:hypothetical protein
MAILWDVLVLMDKIEDAAAQYTLKIWFSASENAVTEGRRALPVRSARWAPLRREGLQI